MTMTHTSATVLVIAIVCAGATSAWADGPLCPAGEITLGPGVLRLVRGAGGPGKVVSSEATFALPSGVAIDPVNEPVVFALEADRQPLGVLTLLAGAFSASGGDRRFVYQNGGSRLALRRVRAAYRLSARHRGASRHQAEHTPPCRRRTAPAGGTATLHIGL
jgi:hypothetical protein